MAFITTQITNNPQNNSATDHRRHFYSTRPAFNADSTRIVLQQGTEGTTLASTQVITDLSGNLIMTLPTINKEVVWSRSNPDVIFGIREGSTYDLVKYNIATNTTEVLYSNTSSFQIGRRKGKISDDERWVAIDVGGSVRVIDLTDGSTLASGGVNLFNSNSHLTITRNGTHVIALESDGAGGRNFYRRDRDLSNRVLLSSNTNHADIHLGLDGKDYLLMQGAMELIDIAANTKVNIDLSDNGGSSIYGGHISGTGPDGIYLSSMTVNGNRQIAALAIADGAAMVTNRVIWEDIPDFTSVSYRAQRKPSMSPNGKYAIYTQDFNNGTNWHDEYLIEDDTVTGGGGGGGGGSDMPTSAEDAAAGDLRFTRDVHPYAGQSTFQLRGWNVQAAPGTMRTWTKISGPDLTGKFNTPTGNTLQVTNADAGVYRFQFKITATGQPDEVAHVDVTVGASGTMSSTFPTIYEDVDTNPFLDPDVDEMMFTNSGSTVHLSPTPDGSFSLSNNISGIDGVISETSGNSYLTDIDSTDVTIDIAQMKADQAENTEMTFEVNNTTLVVSITLITTVADLPTPSYPVNPILDADGFVLAGSGSIKRYRNKNGSQIYRCVITDGQVDFHLHPEEE